MSVRDAQLVLASSRYYKGAIDGDAGPATFRAVEIISSQKAADKSLLFLNNVPVNWDDELNADVINHFLEHLAKK